jgi:hypothetical protein
MKISDDEKARRMVEAFRPLAEMGNKNPAAVALGKIKSAKKAKTSAVTMHEKQNDRRGGFGSGQWLAGESTTTKKKEKQMNEQDKTAIIGAIELEIDGYLDGAPDANEASKLANRISLIIQNGLPLPYVLPKGSITRECEAKLASRNADGQTI